MYVKKKKEYQLEKLREKKKRVVEKWSGTEFPMQSF